MNLFETTKRAVEARDEFVLGLEKALGIDTIVDACASNDMLGICMEVDSLDEQIAGLEMDNGFTIEYVTEDMFGRMRKYRETFDALVDATNRYDELENTAEQVTLYMKLKSKN
jgi:hypothetical protein